MTTAEDTMEAKLKEVAVRRLGKSAHKYWRDVVCDIMAVYEGMKPGFLYDYGTITSNDLSSFSSDIIRTLPDSQEKDEVNLLEVGTKLCIISLGQDVILANQTLLLHQLDEQLNKMQSGVVSNIIDISENLSSPQILSLSSSSAKKLKHNFDQLFEQLKQTIPRGLVDGQIVQIDVDTDEDMNLTTVFGLLIGYPVLYWYRGGAQASNCLDMVPLEVYEVVCDVMIPAQSKHSSHTQLEADKETQRTAYRNMPASRAGNATDSSSGNELLLKSGHVAFSFSVPECIVGHFDRLIMSWFEGLQVGTNSELIQKMCLRKKTVSLPSVAL